MGGYTFDDEAPGLVDKGSNAAVVIVRAFGFVLMLIGFFIAVKIMFEAWGLYRDPAGIEPFAVAVEQGSGLDRALAGDDGEAAAGATGGDNFRLSYFIAWFIAILLLLLVGRLAIAAMRCGGELVLYDIPLKRVIQELKHSAGRG